MSDSIKEIAIALSKVQAELQHALIDSANTHFKNKYASLESYLNEIKKVLPKHGLSFSQTIEIQDREFYILKTLLIHNSGETISSICPLILNKKDMQGLGSAITYARRYSLAALLGMSQDDDDGNSSNTNEKLRSFEPNENAKFANSQIRKDNIQNKKPANHAPNGQGLISESDAREIFKSAKELGLAPPDVKEIIEKICPYAKSSQEIKKSDLDSIYNEMSYFVNRKKSSEDLDEYLGEQND